MAKRVVDGPAVSGEIDKVPGCFEHSCGLIGASRSMIDASPDANGVSCARKVVWPQRSTDSAEKAVAQYPFLDGDDDTISQFVDDLAVAYAAAREIGDDVGLETYGKALKAIGRYLAFEIGPKAAGIKLS